MEETYARVKGSDKSVFNVEDKFCQRLVYGKEKQTFVTDNSNRFVIESFKLIVHLVSSGVFSLICSSYLIIRFAVGDSLKKVVIAVS